MKKILLLVLLILIFQVSSIYAKEGCEVEIDSQTTREFLTEIPDINSQLQQCSPDVDGTLKKVFKNGDINVNIAMTDNTVESFVLSIQGGRVAKISRDQIIGTYVVNVNEADFDTILQNEDTFGAVISLYKQKKLTFGSGRFFTRLKLFFIKPIVNIGLNRMQLVTNIVQIGPYPDKWACEFYQIPYPGVNKKHVSCPYETPGAAANQAADVFCQTVLTSLYAKAERCDENGIIVCTNPCETTPRQIIPTRCPYDVSRTRGNQAAPLNYCKTKVNVNTGEVVKKSAGEVCQHGGECKSGNCVGVGQGPPWTYQCSCDPFKFVAGNC